MLNGEQYAEQRLEVGQRMLNLWKGDIWSDSDLEFWDSKSYLNKSCYRFFLKINDHFHFVLSIMLA
jgi:hypothetical protein